MRPERFPTQLVLSYQDLSGAFKPFYGGDGIAAGLGDVVGEDQRGLVCRERRRTPFTGM
ncbi:MAG TPA: hypothetical protein GXZ82_03450 [Firmicutes bacterium]|jgi:hypothetical protein|nr:hypothetical protein [Bacillota bacterium]